MPALQVRHISGKFQDETVLFANDRILTVDKEKTGLDSGYRRSLTQRHCQPKYLAHMLDENGEQICWVFF
jgi:hypothetical protein